MTPLSVYLSAILMAMLLLISSAVCLDQEESDEAELAAAANVAEVPSRADWLAYIRQQNRYNKRAKPNDPRNLFAAIYDNYGSNMG